ncbi:transglycosylase family protein [Aeromicrobium sp. Marseille-Q0843]|uniref:Transglycosylase family protein n=1 Tax=Aeromicrobium phoceense TaxID=2754045 RepID=A0A838XMM9_9ACTN|nr:resuscitation-promoting factor [Aeromicrobium phoceense]MBA4608110.1 transglycosylase family protein [Aeromicrobium phoceense]
MALAAVGLAVAVGGVVHASTYDDLVRFDVDGVVTEVRTESETVSELLAEKNVTLDPADQVSPAPATDLDDGDVVKVRRAKAVTLVVDGKISQRTVNDVDVAGALETLNVQPKEGASFSMAPDERLGLEGNSVVVSNPKPVILKVDGKKQKLVTAAPTVQSLLQQRGVKVGEMDEVKPGLGSYLKPRQSLRVVRIEKVTRTEKIEVDHEVEFTDDSSLYEGDTEVLKEGRDGLVRAKVELILADGEVRKRRVISRSTVRPPIAEVQKRGTKNPDTVDGGVWDRIAKCESGGNWSINTGNGYYGGLQFSAATWHSVGGPGLPHQHSKATQIKYAKILQARSGWGQWSCAAKVGVN